MLSGHCATGSSYQHWKRGISHLRAGGPGVRLDASPRKLWEPFPAGIS